MTRRSAFRILTALMATASAVAAMAGTLTIKAPTANSFVGRSSALRFQLNGARVEATVRVVLALPGGGSTTIERRFTPNDAGIVDSSIPLSFSEGTPTGVTTATVSVSEPGNTYANQSVSFTVDVTDPELVSVSPLNGGYVRNVVRIRGRIKEVNLQNWEVLVDNQIIPNNTGTTNDIAVDWNTAGIGRDGARTIAIRVTDLAGNVTTRSVGVTLDRIRPTVTVAFPTATSSILRGQTVSVIVDIADSASTSVDATGIDVIVRGLDGTFISRVARISSRASSGTTIRWTGRIRPGAALPNRFKIVATATDRAGNVGTPQEVVVTLR